MFRYRILSLGRKIKPRTIFISTAIIGTGITCAASTGYYYKYHYLENLKTKYDVPELIDQDVDIDDILAEIVETDTEDQTYVQYIYIFFKSLARITIIYINFVPLIALAPFLCFESTKQYWYKMYLSTLKKCGPCFIKLGQWMATRPDIFPTEFCDLLSDLHSNGMIHSYEETKEILEEYFQLPMEEIFDEFNSTPIASGSIAQVYKARMKSVNDTKSKYGSTKSGSITTIVQHHHSEINKMLETETTETPYVAVKVRHPSAPELMVTDLKIMNNMASILSMLPYIKWFKFDEMIKVFSINMKEQLNLEREAINLKIFANNFKNIKNITFPEPLYYNEKLLIETFEEGKSIAEFTDIDNKFRLELADMGVNLYLKMLFGDNFLHGDLHPGNMLVRIENDKPHLVLLDAGLVCRLNKVRKQNFDDLFTAVVKRDGHQVAEMMIDRNKFNKDNITEQDRFTFIKDMSKLVEDVVDSPPGSNKADEIMFRLLNICRSNHVHIDPSYATLIMSCIIIDGVGQQLNPDIKFMVKAKEVLQYNPEIINLFLRAKISEYVN
jgi:aarF domain-containing kinase